MNGRTNSCVFSKETEHILESSPWRSWFYHFASPTFRNGEVFREPLQLGRDSISFPSLVFLKRNDMWAKKYIVSVSVSQPVPICRCGFFSSFAVFPKREFQVDFRADCWQDENEIGWPTDPNANPIEYFIRYMSIYLFPLLYEHILFAFRTKYRMQWMAMAYTWAYYVINSY